MIIVLKRGTEPDQVAEVIAAAEGRGLSCRALVATDKPVLHILSGDTRRARKLLKLERVQALVPTSGPRLRTRGHRFFPYHFLNWCSATLMLLAFIVLLAGQMPPGLGPSPDPRIPAGPPVTPWWGTWIAKTLADAPAWAGPLGFVAAMLFLIALPTIDRSIFGDKEGA